MPAFNNHGLKLVDLRGKAYDDPMWDDLIEQLSLEDMNNLIANGGYQTIAIKSIEKIATVDCDGPAAINNNFTQVGSIGFPSAVMFACTWNTDLANEFGNCIGDIADEMQVSGCQKEQHFIQHEPFGLEGYFSALPEKALFCGLCRHAITFLICGKKARQI